jgi:hypothetical protein
MIVVMVQPCHQSHETTMPWMHKNEKTGIPSRGVRNVVAGTRENSTTHDFSTAWWCARCRWAAADGTGLVADGATRASGAVTVALMELPGASGWAAGVEVELAKAATTPARMTAAVKLKKGSFFMMLRR